MSALRHGRDDHAADEVRGSLPESIEEAASRPPAPVAVDLQAAYGELYPEEEHRERRNLFGRRRDGDAQPESQELSRGERRAQERAAREHAKQAERAAREAEKLAAAKAKEDEKLAREHAKQAERVAREAEKLAAAKAKEDEKLARERAKEAERAAKEDEKLARERAKEAERAAKEAEKLAAAKAKEDEKLAREHAKEAEQRAREQAKEAERRAAAEAEEEARERKEAAKRAAVRAKEAEKAAREAEKLTAAQAREAEKLAAAQAKENEKRERVQAKEAEKAAKEAEKRAAAEAKEAEKLAKARAKEADKAARAEAKEAEKAAKAERRAAAKAERQRRRETPRRKRKPRGERGKGKGAKKLVGLKIGASQIAAAQVSNNGAPELVDAVREPLEPGLVVSGEVRDPDALAASLKRFFDTHKLPKKGIRLGISNNRIGVRVFEIEGVQDEAQLENAIRFRAEDVLPIPLEQAVLDYVVLGEEERDDGTHVHRILLVVAYRDVVDRYLLACRGAGLEVVGIDLEAFALLRALSAPTETFAGGGALIAATIGHDRTTIAVSTGRYCDFTRVLDWGGWSLNVVIARALDLAPSEVEGIKRQVSLTEERPIEGLTSEQVTKAREAVRSALGAFARELVASLQFYQAQPGALGIGEIQLTGGAAHLPGFTEELGRLIGVRVRAGDPLRRMMVSKDVGHIEQIGSFAVAIGLGIED